MLLTGFEPFGDDNVNPSALLVRAMAADPPPAVALRTAVLPTAFDRAGALLDGLLSADPPDAVLALGLAGGRSGLTVERVAINLCDARIPDNDGRQPVDLPCVPGAPTAYLSTLPVKRMAAAIRAAGIEAAVSHSAGTFVCNHVLFMLLHRAAVAGDGMGCAFIHLPLLPGQRRDAPDLPTLPLAGQLRGVRAALAALLPGAGDPDADGRSEGALH